MNVNKNFVGSRMNKALDERLIPPGEYRDALNIRISSDEDGEAFTAENPKGNEKLTSLSYNGSILVNPKCIGAIEDGTNERIYWFVTSDNVDMIVSYNTRNDSLVYHLISVSVLNFGPFINGINIIDDFLFFTDNLNPPRRINVKSSYPQPLSGVDQITEDDISVIVKPPYNSPSLTLLKNTSKQNYIEDKFIRFAYRYKYKDGEYSALSEFSDIAFTPGQFRLDYGSYDMIGMKNNSNLVNVTFNTGPSDVIGVDLCFKLSNSNVLNVVEKYIKKDNGWPDNFDVSVDFTNQKIYTTLPESELLRIFDNVPKRAKSQTTMGNRIIYGNYYDGYDIDTVMDYSLLVKNEDIGFTSVPESKSNGQSYTIGSSISVADSRLEIDLTDIELKNGGTLNIDFNIIHSSFQDPSGTFIDGGEVENSYTDVFQFTFPRDYVSVQDLATDVDFLNAINLTDPGSFPNTSDGYSLSDLFFSNIQLHSGGDWEVSGAGITSSPQGFLVSYSGNIINIQIPGIEYQSISTPANYAYEYFLMGSTTVSVTEIGNRSSLHSNRDYEVGIVYLDDYNRATTALVSNNNTAYVEPQNSVTKNTITATINHKAPSWAKRYRFVMKPSKGAYDTIYSNKYYFDSTESAWWVKLDGDNQTKTKIGDNLIVKVDSQGPVFDVVKTKVLDLKTQEKGFIDDSGSNLVPPNSGLYMKLVPTQYSISQPENSDIDFGNEKVKNFPYIAYPTYIEDPDNPGTYINYDIPAGTEVRIYFNNRRKGSGDSCGSRYFKFDRTFVATRDYDNLYDFIVQENIDFNDPTNNPEVESSDDTTPDANFISAISGYNPPSYLYPIVPDRDEGTTQIFWAETSANGGPAEGTSGYKSSLVFVQAGGRCNGRNYWLNVQIQVFRAGGLLTFETIPQENTNEIYYESTNSYPITSDGYHTSNNQDQTATLPAIVDLDMYNCFSFGNGVESFKIEDGIDKPGFNMGARVTSVSEQDYKEAHRYTDVTYSGIYNEESNVNKLNEFNLGLSNYKTLEKSFGPINVLHGRLSDILVLQEDKISYVLANGKNLFSDATAGGAILSTPDVLGQQIPRVEENGISDDSESFVSFDKDVFFTDTKRGAVINLKGNVGVNDQMNIISSIGMRSWFRDRFIDDGNKIKIGGYDPYSKEYVLSISDESKEVDIDRVDCGFTVSQERSSTPVTYIVDTDNVLGDLDIDYSVQFGFVNISVTYDGSEVINQDVSGTGVLTFSLDTYNLNEFNISITPTDATYSVDIGCVQSQEITVIKIVKNTDEMDNQTIHHEYNWSSGSYTSPVSIDSIEFNQGPVSLYESFTGQESSGIIPSEGSVVTMRYRKNIGDSASWNNDKFKYLISDVLYTESDIDTLTPLLQEATPITNPSENVYEASFTYDNPSDNAYLYLVWDYIPPAIECTDSLSFTGEEGIYEFEVELGTDIGETFFTFDSLLVPDRFQIYYDGSLVADSLFVGDGLPNSGYESAITSATTLNKYTYDGVNFIPSSVESVNFSASDIADSSTNRPTGLDGSVGDQVGVVGGYPSGTPLASDGSVKLKFNKEYAYPSSVTVVATGVGGTVWQLTDISCPSGSIPEYIHPTKGYYSQVWGWEQTNGDFGALVDVVIVNYNNYLYMWTSTINNLGSPLLLSTSDFVEDNPTDLVNAFNQSVGGSLITQEDFQEIDSNEYPIIDDL